MTQRGRFIVIEGGDGAGKSRLQAALASHLQARGCDVVQTREPGGTPLGEQVRALVLAQQALDDPLAELLLFEAARAQLVSTVVRPALARGTTVICDRFAASSIAYQSFGRGLPRDLVERLNTIATGGLVADLTLLLDLPVTGALARRVGAGERDHFDREAAAFHDRVRAGFLEQAHDGGDAWCVIDAEEPFDAVAALACGAVDAIV